MWPEALTTKTAKLFGWNIFTYRKMTVAVRALQRSPFSNWIARIIWVEEIFVAVLF
jgi:hypothetical protein